MEKVHGRKIDKKLTQQVQDMGQSENPATDRIRPGQCPCIIIKIVHSTTLKRTSLIDIEELLDRMKQQFAQLNKEVTELRAEKLFVEDKIKALTGTICAVESKKYESNREKDDG